MASIKRHIFKKPDVDMQAWPIDPLISQTLNAETLVYYDTTAKYLKELINDTNAAYCVGLLKDQVPVGLYSDTLFDQGGGNKNPNYPDNHAMVSRYGQAEFYCTTGDSYTAGQVVYAGADGQHIVDTAGTNPVGYVSGEQADITTATSGQKVLIDYRGTWPNVPVR